MMMADEISAKIIYYIYKNSTNVSTRESLKKKTHTHIYSIYIYIYIYIYIIIYIYIYILIQKITWVFCSWSSFFSFKGSSFTLSGFFFFGSMLCHALRKEVWKFLLGYYSWNSTRDERTSMQKRKTDEYFRMKLQWKSVSEEQEKRNCRLRDYRSLIEKDVNRTDRTNKFYEGQDNPGLILLHDILMTYCMYDFDLGYVQGMSDLLSPILYVMENEVDAFWCFALYMDQMHQNFEEQMQGMKTQLIQLSTLLRLLDSGFCNYLESQDSGYLYFCFRWLLIRFKREFSFQDILRLWEVMWTDLPCQNFHLLLCCAILESEKQQIMEKHYGFNEILKHINELSMKMDVDDILCKAEAVSMQMMTCKELPQAICEILGLENSAMTTPDSDAGEDETVDGMSCLASTYPNVSLPVAVVNKRNEKIQQVTHTDSTN
uniref:TBC1 domain family member 15 n=1 Tax=Laticauda laticaudata TaxID=8630 RepID=A0A8C5SFJ8_LATLA